MAAFNWFRLLVGMRSGRNFENFHEKKPVFGGTQKEHADELEQVSCEISKDVLFGNRTAREIEYRKMW